jgi:hypothetical protein
MKKKMVMQLHHHQSKIQINNNSFILPIGEEFRTRQRLNLKRKNVTFNWLVDWCMPHGTVSTLALRHASLGGVCPMSVRPFMMSPTRMALVQ